MGARLSSAVEAYNAAVGSLERQVMPQARRFHDLGVTADAPTPALEPIGQLVRSSGAPSVAETPAVAAPDNETSAAGDAPHVRKG